jgi:Flp pilus assembly protein TadG
MQRLITRTQRGAAAVEFAILLPLLLAILCGTIDWGYYFFTREVVVNASREGARVGTLQFAPGKIPRDEAKTAAQAYLNGALPRARAATITTGTNAQGSDCPASSSCVRIDYPIGGSITGFLGPLIPSSIVAYAEMRM